MDARVVKTMMLFLQGPCKGAAIVVNIAKDADVDVFDADAPVSKKLLVQCLQENRLKPVIVLSLQDFAHDGILHIKKPVKTSDMLLVLNQAKTLADELSKKTTELDKDAATEAVENDLIDLFNDEFFGYIATTTWDDPVAKTGAAEILRRVDTPQKQEPKTPVNDQDGHSKTPEDQMATPAQVSPEPKPIAEIFEEQVDETAEKQESTTSVTDQDEPEKQELKTFLINQERQKTSKHQTAMRLDEKGFHAYIGSISDLDVNDPGQIINACYSPKDYFQGYVQSAFAACRTKGRALLLQSGWRPITIFPYTEEIWLDARDSELSAFAGIKLKYKTIAPKIAITPIDPKAMNLGGALDKFQSMDAFLWKLACWTSKGRYPQDIDYRHPIYLRSWPNFTRLLITPHALRIAALLIQGPRTMINVAEMLNIKPQYVFVFVSAAYSVSLVGQARRLADSLVQPPVVTPSKGQGLLGRIMSKLRGNKT